MITTELLLSAAKWSAILTIVFVIITGLSFIRQWGLRFRLVGATGFMGVLTGGIFALSLGLYTRVEIPNAVHYNLVYDNGGKQTTIRVPPTISELQLDATMRQAANDLYSPGRLGGSGDKLVIRVRTIIHPETGVSQPLVLGEVRRSLLNRYDDKMAIEIYKDKLALLPKPTA